MKNLIKKYIEDKKVLILGFGREGRSTYRLLRNYFPVHELGIADKNEITDFPELSEDKHLRLHTGDNYLEVLSRYPIIFKSPGIPMHHIDLNATAGKILTQTSLFLERYRSQIIGVTGTKGKSTTASLITHILTSNGFDAILLGNIGLPPFDFVADINDQTTIVFELSAHQLEITSHSPHMAILLNIFQEHLDHFQSYQRYTHAKMNVCKYQMAGDYFFYNSHNKLINTELQRINCLSTLVEIPDSISDNPEIIELEKIRDTLPIKGKHNFFNMILATEVCMLKGIEISNIIDALKSFTPLPHRMEYLGKNNGVNFYNDSISTIPESTIEAIKAIPNVQTLILGGYDRGIDYTELMLFLAQSDIRKIIFTGPAGKRMLSLFESNKTNLQVTVYIEDFNSLKLILPEFTIKGSVCLLSPAASSYDRFQNFEHRGNMFKNIVGAL